jgi:hypothetical protein
MEREQLIWLAGWLEGEGSFQLVGTNKTTAYIKGGSDDLDVVEQAARIMETDVHPYKGPKGKPHYVVYLSSTKAVELAMQLYPFMKSRRRAAIVDMLRGTKDHIIGNYRE